MTGNIDAATPEIRPTRRSALSNISFVWLVPLLALTISLGVAWQSYSDRGVLIEIAFDNASGVEPGKTQLRYRDVSVGIVERVTFSTDLSQVLVQVRVDKDVAGFIDADAQFWVERPQVSVRGVSGLGTVLSGVYLNGTWDAEVGAPVETFTGLDNAPLVRPGSRGTTIVLRSSNGNQLAAGAPILFKGIRVGTIEAPVLMPSGNAVVTNGFIDAPYDRLVTSATRFWDTSGFSLSLGTGGVRLNVDSLASLVEGGVTFENLVSGGTPINPGAIFPIYDSAETARNSLFQEANIDLLQVSAIFDGSISGLTVGADVRFQGVKIGEVSDLVMTVERINNRRSVRMRAELKIRPGSLGLGEDAGKADALNLLREYVSNGLRARLTSANILTGELVVDLVELPDEPPETLDIAAKPHPILPTSVANLSDFNATAEGVFERFNNLKIEELIDSTTGVLDGIRGLVTSQGGDDTLPDLISSTIAVLNDFEGLVGTDGEQTSLPDLIASAAAVLDSFDTLVTSDGQQTTLPELITSAIAVMDGVNSLVDSEGAQAALPELTATLNEARQVLAEIREAGAGAKVNSALSSAEGAAKAIESAAARLPALAEQLERLSIRTETVLAAYGEQSRLVGSALTALRDISGAAESLQSLARTIQRNPNSLLLGR